MLEPSLRGGASTVPAVRGDTRHGGNAERKAGRRQKLCRHHHFLFKDNISPVTPKQNCTWGIYTVRGARGCLLSSILSFPLQLSSSGSSAAGTGKPLPRRRGCGYRAAGGRQGNARQKRKFKLK